MTGCSAHHPPIRTVDHVDIDRFMGNWYVIAAIPTFIEKNAYNAIESYERTDARTIKTTFTFNRGSMDGPLQTYNPTGFISDDPSNAVWGMQFIWPVKADYRIIHLADDYSTTVIGRTRRDYVWIMARQPTVNPEIYQSLVKLIGEQGYPTDAIRQVPHRQTATVAP